MRCEDARPLLDLLADDRLETSEADRLEAHLARCPDCREEAEGLTAVAALVREIPRPSAPDGFAESVLDRLPARPPAVRTEPRRRYALFLAPIAAAACLLLVVVLTSEPPAGRVDVAAGAPKNSTSLEAPSLEAGTLGEARDDAEPAVPGSPAGPPPCPEEAPVERTLRSAWGDDSRSYLVDGEPDSVAGVLLAELGHRRDREAGSKAGGKAGGKMEAATASTRSAGVLERVARNEKGVPTVVYLSLTRAEEDFCLDLLAARGELSRLRAEFDYEEAEGAARNGAIGIGGGAGGAMHRAGRDGSTKPDSPSSGSPPSGSPPSGSQPPPVPAAPSGGRLQPAKELTAGDEDRAGRETEDAPRRKVEFRFAR